MKNVTKKLLAALCAAAVMTSFASCSDEKTESEAETSGTGALVDENGDPEFVTDPDEPDMGEYTISEKGTKLYYDPEAVSPELMEALEGYFVAYSQNDYEAYTEWIYPEYITEMTKYLEKDFGYDMETSFSSQYESLKANAGGEFTVTRIKAELPEESGLDEYFATLDEIFETDFYESVKADADELHDLIFYVIAEAEGEETLLISEFEIVFAEKDGRYYTFG